MKLTESELKWLAQRRTLLSLWPWTGGGMIAGLLGFATWLWLSVPLMINPWATVRAIEAGSVEDSTLTIMAVMLPILMLACLGLIVGIIVILFAVFGNERRLIALVEKLDRENRAAGPWTAR